MSVTVYPARAPLCVPYWNGRTYKSILRSFASGTVVAGPELCALESLLEKKFRAADTVLCGSGSLALEIALRACGIGRGDEVIIPTFCCTAVVPPILAAGALPVLSDVGGELNIDVESAAAAMTPKTRAVVVPHLFGNPADIERIAALAQERNIRVIDDAAQALGATVHGQPVGSFGDAGILSFGAEKVCFGLGGGAAFSRKREVAAGLKADLSPPRFCSVVATLGSTLVWRRWRRWTFPLEAALSRARKSGPDLPPAPYRKEAMANLKAAVAVSLLEALPENLAARRARVRAYQSLLGTTEGLELVPHRDGSACLAQVVRILPKRAGEDRAARAIGALRKAGYEVQGSYVPIHLIARYAGLARRALPYAETVWPDLIELPCEPDVSLDDVERIAAIVKQAAQN
ncbi:MAG TPA: DegT/DnrJ/EryC1/StrS family aminotransferase [Candidatus Acidoferrales bacterium]|nr:DegT/DnrJ/EryC1/StrS family aminotransferase [Candidatus Acidoferrales bacterium]